MKYWKDILIAVMFIFITLFISNQSCMRRDRDNLNNNIKALNDTISVLKLKNGELLNIKQSLILERDQIHQYLNITNKELKDIEKKLQDKISLISELKNHINIDTILIIDSIYIKEDNIYSSFKYKDDWLLFDGDMYIKDSISTLRINNINITTDLKIGITQEYKVFTSSSNPYLQFSSIETAVINESVIRPKVKRWNIGAQIGVGTGYDIIHKNTFVGPYIGIGLSCGINF